MEPGTGWARWNHLLKGFNSREHRLCAESLEGSEKPDNITVLKNLTQSYDDRDGGNDSYHRLGTFSHTARLSPLVMSPHSGSYNHLIWQEGKLRNTESS